MVRRTLTPDERRLWSRVARTLSRTNPAAAVKHDDGGKRRLRVIGPCDEGVQRGAIVIAADSLKFAHFLKAFP